MILCILSGLMMENKIQKLKEIIRNSSNIVVFTGAGISSESGIPTYRGSEGVWSKYDPNIYANINVFIQDSTYYWHYFKDERYPVIKNAKPNITHYSIVKLEKKGKINCVITQNIDGLHQMAGSSKVIELHGNTRIIFCLKCEKKYSIDEVYSKLQKELPPFCSCGGRLKTNTILFGEPLPPIALSKAEIAAKNCDLFLALGSSLVVYPAANLPIIAKNNSSYLVIINLDETPLDNIADLVIHDKVSNILSKLIQ
jgi:NAD-dependent deacetylase